MATTPRAQVVIDGNIGPLRQVLREGSSSVQSFGDKASGALGGLPGQAMAFRTQLIGIVGVITSGAFSALVKHQINLQDEFSKSAQKAGVTTEAYSGMAYAAKLADVGTEDLTKTYAKLSDTLIDAQQGQKLAVDLFKQLKLDPKNIKDADTLLLQLAERFSSMPDGIAKTALSVDVFGEKLGPRLIPMLNAGRDGIESLRKEAAELGIVVSTEAGRNAEKFNDTITTMGAVTTGVANRLATAMLPALQAVATELLNASKTWGGFDAVANGFKVTFEAIAVVGANVAFVFNAVGREIGAWGAQLAALAQGELGQFHAISDAVKADGVRARKELDELEKRILGIGQAPAAPAAASGAAPFTPAAKVSNITAKAPPSAPTSYLKYYELQLAEEKRAQSVLEAGREYGKERELAYWQYLLQNLQLTSDDRISIARKTAQLEVDIARKTAEERTAVDGEYARQAEAALLGKVEAQRAGARVALDLEQITRGQFLQLDAEYEQQRYEIQRAAIAERLALLDSDPTSSVLEKASLNGQLLELDQQYAARRTELLGGIAKESTSGGALFAGIGDSFGQALDGLLLRTQSWGAALGNIYSGIRNTFIKTIITEPFSKWVASQARMVAMKLGFIAQETAAQTAGSTAAVGIKTTEAGVVVAANAAEAGSGTAAALASIPFVGPFLALAAMATVFAAVSALGGKSAAGGYDIPSGINPMVQTHEEEMILPKQISNGLRGIIADGGAGQGGGGSVTIQLNAMDSRTGGQWLIDNSDAIAASLRRARRDGA